MVALYALLLLGTGATMSGCLITQPVHFDQPPNSPPAIDTDGQPFPLDRIVRLPSATSSDGGTPTTTNATFGFNVFDPDVGQTLQFKVFIDGSLVPALERSIPVSSASTGRDRRQVSFPVDLSPFGALNACHRVEVFVSSQFVFGSRQQPVIDHDVASATWWIAWRPDSSNGVDMIMCP